MNLRLFHRIVRQVVIVPVVALIVVAFLLYLQVQTFSTRASRIQESDQTIAQSNLLGRLVIDQETSVRGYAATGDTRFLDPWNKAAADIPGTFASLNKFRLDKDEKEKIAQLHTDYDTWIESFARPVLAMTRGRDGATDNPAARDIDLNITGKRMMDQVRADLADLANVSETHRQRRVARWQRQIRLLVGGLALFSLVVGIFIGLFNRSRLRLVSRAYQVSLDSLHKRSEEIFVSEQRLRTTLASIGDGVITCSAGGNIVMMNQVACELTGWSQEEAADRPLHSVFQILSEQTREVVEDPVAKVMRLNRVVGLANHTLLIRKDGTELNIDDSGAPIRDHDGTISGVVLVFRDVTLEKRTQKALIASEKLAVAGRLAASIAHEIHNPLDSVANILYLLNANDSPEENAHLITMAQQELSRVTQISRSMLSLYRESTVPIPIDIKDILEGTVVLLDHRIHGLESTVDIDIPGPLLIEGFPAELRQVFTNLVVNAVEAAGPGGHIRIHAHHLPAGNNAVGERHEDGVQIEITDNGPGIVDADLHSLFQPFFSTKGEKGTGLGLWVSQGIIRKHGGTIDLQNRPDTPGAIARVFLATHPTITAGGD